MFIARFPNEAHNDQAFVKKKLPGISAQLVNIEYVIDGRIVKAPVWPAHPREDSFKVEFKFFIFPIRLERPSPWADVNFF